MAVGDGDLDGAPAVVPAFYVGKIDLVIAIRHKEGGQIFPHGNRG